MSGTRECGVCWSVYDPAVGDDVWQIPPGTAFEDLPADWRCPKCDSGKEKFVRPEAESTSSPVSALEAGWRAAATRMAGLPICNPHLGIELFGFREHAGGWAGVAVTPWFMNVIFVPRGDEPKLPPGTKRPREFPSGVLEFVVGSLDGVGVVEACSLFSPMNDFPDMATAQRVAREAVDALFTAPVDATPTPPAAAAPSRRDLFRRAFARR